MSQKQLQIFDTRCSFREISPCFLSILFSFSLLRRGPNFPATQLHHPTPFNFYSWQKYKQTTEKRCLSHRYQCPTRLDIRGYIMYGLFKNSSIYFFNRQPNITKWLVPTILISTESFNNSFQWLVNTGSFATLRRMKQRIRGREKKKRKKKERFRANEKKRP